MSTSDDAFMRALYGPNFGKAHQDQYAGAESQRSAEDPSRRTAAEDGNSNSSWFRPSRSIFGAEIDQSLGVKPGAAGLMPIDENWHDQADTEPVVVDVDPLASIVETEMSDGWRDTVAAFAASHTDFTSDQVLIDAFGMVAEFIERGDQMRVAEILRELGYESRQKRVNGERQNLWTKLS